MKHITVLFLISFQLNVYAQNGHVQATAMEKLKQLEGHWQGQGWIQERGDRSDFRQSENVQFKLGGTTLLIEGKGYVEDSLIFQAMAIISYDVINKHYRFNSFLADGKYVEANGNFNDDGSFYWQFEVPGGGVVKYDIYMTDTTWNEKGSYSPKDTDQSYPFLKMNLTKKN